MSPARRERGVEWLCVRECVRFSLRHRRYFFIACALYWHSLRHWTQARAARYGFCFLQLYDDIMDGDRASATPRALVADRVIGAWQRGTFDDDDALSRLGGALHAALRALPLLPSDDPHRDVLALLRAMRDDAQRIATSSLLAAHQIKEQLRSTFHHSLNLLLIASGLTTRVDEIPDLVEAMGWCSVVRDLDEDLAKGLVNIPADVVMRVRDSGSALTPRHPDVQRWLSVEKASARRHLDSSAVALRDVAAREPNAGRLLGLFQRSVERYAR